MTSSEVPPQSTTDQPNAGPSPNTSELKSGPADPAPIPVLAERIHIGKRLIETGQVHLVKTVHQDQQAIDVDLVSQHFDVERVPMDQLLEEAPTTRQEGDTTIYPILQEEYIVVKRFRVVEEIRVTKRQVQTTEHQMISVRREDVTVERIALNPVHERSDSPGESSL